MWPNQKKYWSAVKKIKTIVLLLLCANVVFSQAPTDTVKVYTSLEAALKNPSQVKKLDLTKNKLDVFPQEIFLLKNLRELYLGKNKIDSIPPQINQLTKLEVLDISKNRLTKIPVELFSCMHLKRLVLNQNLIEEVPPEISKLQELEYLDMWSNELETLPQDIGKCKKLKEVDLRVININTSEQERIAKLLPNAKVHMSPSCNCSH